jgi:hypothetical protein
MIRARLPSGGAQAGALMRSFWALSFVCFILACGGCAKDTKPVAFSAPADAYFKSLPLPPSGYARVYVLPPRDEEGDIAGDLYLSTADEEKILPHSVRRNEYAAFDVRPGRWMIGFEPDDYYYFDEEKSFALADRQVLLLRPVHHYSGNVIVPFVSTSGMESSGMNVSGDGALIALLGIAAIDIAMLPVTGVMKIFATRQPEFETLSHEAMLGEVRSRSLARALADN